MRNCTWLSLVVIGLAACATDASEDGVNDSFTGDGKADTGGISEGTPEALGALRVANEASRTELRSGVGLSSRAAANIVAFRLGDDGTPGTADDRSFSTLAELDAVPYVGPIAFGKLVAYAKANGEIPSVTKCLSGTAPTDASSELSSITLSGVEDDGGHFDSSGKYVPSGNTRPVTITLHGHGLLDCWQYESCSVPITCELDGSQFCYGGTSFIDLDRTRSGLQEIIFNGGADNGLDLVLSSDATKFEGAHGYLANDYSISVETPQPFCIPN